MKTFFKFGALASGTLMTAGMSFYFIKFGMGLPVFIALFIIYYTCLLGLIFKGQKDSSKVQYGIITSSRGGQYSVRLFDANPNHFEDVVFYDEELGRKFKEGQWIKLGTKLERIPAILVPHKCRSVA